VAAGCEGFMPERKMTMASVAMETLGCKVNQYESSYFLETLKAAGYRLESFRERADVYVVHSCTVTSKAAFQTRQLLRRAQRINPDARIVVAGCGAQLEPDRFADERLATHVLGNDEKFDLPRWLEAPGSLSDPLRALSNPRHCTDCRSVPITLMHSGRARAFLKVQDGCDTFCSYCIVPFTRGRSRSLPSGEVRAQMDRFIHHGYQEVVLTGIHLGQWGRDLDPEQDLVGLLRLLAVEHLPPRVRLSSLEPMEWSGELVRHLSSSPCICPHFHIPLQSGDEEILKRMHRPYTPREYSEVVRELQYLFPEAALGADVLVGFPGETEHHFNATFELINRLPLTYLHVFPYSPRKGTPAASWPGRVTGHELKRRTRLLQDLGAGKRLVFRERFVGRWVEVLAEVEEKPGWWRGTTPNYLQVRFSARHRPPPGSLTTVQITRATETGLEGQAAP
jgi:threonylcarbamoyladenosine tRNA methylthiotransferase MtaB